MQLLSFKPYCSVIDAIGGTLYVMRRALANRRSEGMCLLLTGVRCVCSRPVTWRC